MILVLATTLALAAEGPAAWDSLNEARVFEAAGGTPDVAVLRCQEGLENTPADDPMRGELLYCVARNRLRLGDQNGALAALREVPSTSSAWGPAHTLIDRIQLQARAIPHVPVVCTFDADTCGFVRTWERLDKGLLERRDIGDRTTLAWDTTVKESEEDRIAVALASDAPVRSVSFRAMATRFEASLRFYLVEGSGTRHLGPVVQIPTGSWTQVTLPVSSFRSADARAGGPPGTVRLVEIVDLSGTLLTDRDANTILFDEIELR